MFVQTMHETSHFVRSAKRQVDEMSWRRYINVEGVTLVLPSRPFMFNEYWRILALS